jgi:Astacin (Peptidase family M12A)/Right handed beta helix region
MTICKKSRMVIFGIAKILPQMFFRGASILKIERTQFFLLRLTVFLFIAFTRTTWAGNFYAGISPANVPWPGGIVPYEFTNTLTAAQQQTYLDGLREWELAANVKFIPHTTETHWVLFAYNTNGFDNVSATTNPQVVSVSSLSRAQVGHEMGHSFGFNHENIRPDAANFITVLTNDITPGNLQFFQIDPTTVTNGPYDFESVMHLGWDFASTNPGVAATQQPKPPYSPRYQFRMGNFTLSPGDRAALKFLYGAPLVPPTNIVTTTADVGPGSLRAAMYYVADNPGAMVKFNIPTNDPGYSNGVFNIHLTGVLPTLATNGMVIDGSTQPGFAGSPLIFVDGSQILPETFTSNSGLLIYSSSNQVKNLSFSGFNWNGLTLEFADATNNLIAGCWLGLDSTGHNAAPNTYQGILVFGGASGNIIGGTNVLSRNVISGNLGYGIFISDSNTTGNVVLGNYLGTDASGSIAVPNGYSGVFVGNGANGNTIGGTITGARNLISGNQQYGVYISGPDTSNNFVLGNYIGSDFTGTNANGNGIAGIGILNDTGGNFIGGNNPSAGNLLSGNFEYGVILVGASNDVIQGNYIGTDVTGKSALGNNYDGIGLWGGSANNLVGGISTGAGNLISGNPEYGMILVGASNNVIQGNQIGTDVSGKLALGNYAQYGGIGVWGGSANNLFGGTSAGAGNLISANAGYGLILEDSGTSGNLVLGNWIGTGLTGSNALGNSKAGVALWGGATNNSIGGIGTGNTIAFNGWAGVSIYDQPTTNNSIRGNFIFSNDYLGIDLNGDGVTTNHSVFVAGPNNLQNFPVITNAFGYSGSTIVAGTFNSLASQTYLIDVYRNLAEDSSGYGQGQVYLGAVSVTTDNNGNANFAYTNSGGNYTAQYISTTATDTNGNTSEFSADVLASNVPAPSAQFAAPLVWRTNGFVFNLTFTTNFSYHIQATTNLSTNPIPWIDLTNFTADSSSFTFTDHTATNFSVRFYRVVSP